MSDVETAPGVLGVKHLGTARLDLLEPTVFSLLGGVTLSDDAWAVLFEVQHHSKVMFYEFNHWSASGIVYVLNRFSASAVHLCSRLPNGQLLCERSDGEFYSVVLCSVKGGMVEVRHLGKLEIVRAKRKRKLKQRPLDSGALVRAAFSGRVWN